MDWQGWAIFPQRGEAMEKMDLPFFYSLGHRLNTLAEASENVGRLNVGLIAIDVQSDLKDLLTGFPLTVCRSDGDALLKRIEDWLNGWPDDIDSEMNTKEKFQVRDIIRRAKAFETILVAELQTLATYHVTQKGIYSTPDLIQRAENTLPEAVRIKLHEGAIAEIRMSGRCLAFDNATASAFHMMRATELVMYQYYVTVCKPKPARKLPNWGAYISELVKSPDDDVKKVVAILQQMKDQDRNLIMHPDVVLSPDEAFTLFEVAQGAIIAMTSRLKPPRKLKKK